MAARAFGVRGIRLGTGPQSLTLGDGDERGVLVKGTGGTRPGFTFAGPGGRTLTVPAGLTQAAAASRVAAVPVGPDAIELQVHDPKGSWTLTPAEGSDIASIESAQELPTPKLNGSVRSAGGRARQLTVRASNLGGQRLVVREVLPTGGAHELGTVQREGTQSLRFTPTDGPAGKRTIEAVVLDGKRTVGVQTITTYVAPGRRSSRRRGA